MGKPSSTQLGAIAENLVSNAIMVESGGRLSPFTPRADDDGIDLLIYDKETGRALPAQVKSRTVTLKKKGSEERGDVVHFEVRHATFRAERYAAAILVLTANNGYEIDTAWVVPMDKLPTVARRGDTKFVLRASRGTKSNDRCTQFRCRSPSELFSRILAMLGAAPPPPDITSQ